MRFHEDITSTEKRHGAYVHFICNILRGIAYYLEWSTKFILHFALHLVDVLEALTSVLLQVFKVVKLLIKVLFSFGDLLKFAGRNVGAEGSFLFVLCLITYFCFWLGGSSSVFSVSGALYINVCIVCVYVWAITIPVGGFLVFVRLRRKIKRQIDLLVNYEEFYEDSEYAAKSTEPVSILQPRAQRITNKELFADKTTETEAESVEFTAIDDDEASDLRQRKDSLSSEGTGKDEEDEVGSRSDEKEGKAGKGKKSFLKRTPRKRIKDKKNLKKIAQISKFS
ncbi:uncharacterized protein LOC116305094 [Actinia tenebrosa]|uniref:Uncharacterized protein LOC116305094 n=1 Tax=Actinia tenebrosa TaxID=6105 RepID=A0A6P8IXP2_ACTTE|nr:uncharacterized protein LOC116305094 [Actinia tenebrosa]